jgi:hypothetical protein
MRISNNTTLTPMKADVELRHGSAFFDRDGKRIFYLYVNPEAGIGYWQGGFVRLSGELPRWFTEFSSKHFEGV